MTFVKITVAAQTDTKNFRNLIHGHICLSFEIIHYANISVLGESKSPGGDLRSQMPSILWLFHQHSAFLHKKKNAHKSHISLSQARK